MSARSSKVMRTGGVRTRGRDAQISPKALYARPMALRQLYADAGSVIRRGQREAAATHEEHSR